MHLQARPLDSPHGSAAALLLQHLPGHVPSGHALGGQPGKPAKEVAVAVMPAKEVAVMAAMAVMTAKDLAAMVAKEVATIGMGFTTVNTTFTWQSKCTRERCATCGTGQFSGPIRWWCIC